jgi:CheY-like chemotaxis protein
MRRNYGRVVSLVGTGHISVPSIRPKTDASPVSYQDPAVARLVHELRNVLMIVLARTDMATQVIDAGHPARPNLEDAKRAVLSAAALIRQFTNGQSYGPATEVSGGGPQPFPVRQQSPAATLAASQSLNAIGRPATILLVEDESLLRESTREFLTSAGFHVLAAESAEEALATVATNPEPVDLLIADRTLPGMSGSALAEILTSASPATKVLLVSGLAKADPQTQPPFTPVHFLAKPFLFSTLHEEVLSLLREKKPALAVSSAL